METPTVQATFNSTNDSTKSSFHMDYGAVLAAAIFEIIITLVGTLGNTFTIIAVLRNRSLQYATNYLIVSLSVADTLVCTILVPMRASQHIAYQYDASIPKTFVEVAGFVGRVNIIASISTLVCLSIDRYLALSRPLKYATSIRYNLWKVLIVIATIWCVAVFITSLPKFPGVTDAPFLIFFIVFVLTATLVICITYYRIFHIITKSIRQVGKPIRYSNNFQESSHKRRASSGYASKASTSEASSESVGGEASAKSSKDYLNASKASMSEASCESVGGEASTKSSKDFISENKTSSKVAANSLPQPRAVPFSRQERKAAKTVGMVIAAFILLVYPRIIMILYHFGKKESSSSIVGRFWMRVLLYSNSAVNPAFYAYRHKGFRREFKKMGLQCLGLGRVLRERYATVKKRGTSGSSTLYA